MLNRFYLINWLLFFSYTAFANPVYQSEFFTGSPYGNNQFNDEILEIPNAYGLIVTINGEIENKWDVITLYDANGQKIQTFTGQLNERIEVAGSKIRVIFDSDNRKHDFLGARVKITAQSFPQLYQTIKQILTNEVTHLLEKNTGEASYLIKQHLKQLTTLDNQVRQARDAAQIIQPVANELLKIAETYRKIANLFPEVQQIHQNILDKLEQLQVKTKTYQQIAQTNVEQLQAEVQTAEDGWRKDNLQRVANLSYTQQTLWTQFLQQQTEMMVQTKVYSAQVLDFLNFLNMTAQIYEGTAQLTLVHRSSIADFQNLMDLSRLRSIVDKIEQSELKINTLLEQIEKNSPLA